MAMAISVPRYTIADLERFPSDGSRYELLDGMLLVTPRRRMRIRSSSIGCSSG